jgi:hypothetical protein
VERIRGGAEEAQIAMRAFCRSVNAPLDKPVGPGEEKFVQQLLRQPPLEKYADLVLYQPPGQLAMVVAVNRPQRRIVGWSFALPADEGSWSLYHFRPLGAGAIAAVPAAATESIAGAAR